MYPLCVRQASHSVGQIPGIASVPPFDESLVDEHQEFILGEVSFHLFQFLFVSLLPTAGSVTCAVCRLQVCLSP